MKTMIYYFSATGNSLHVARKIAAKLEKCTLVSIPEVSESGTIMTDAERVGFVFPTHYFGLPPLVSSFISRLKAANASYLFAVATSGSNRHLSSAIRQAAMLLTKQGYKLNAGFHIDMISSYTPLSDLPPRDKLNGKLEQADLAIEKAATAISIVSGNLEAEHFWLPFHAINKYWQQKLLPHAYRKFACTDACISCGNCETVCPVNNITIHEGKPQWREKCQECLACLHFCPVKSIEFGSHTAGRKRYHHPQITYNDLISPKK